MRSQSLKALLLLLATQGLLITSCSTKKAATHDEPSVSEQDFISDEEVISLGDDLYSEIDEGMNQQTSFAADNIYDDVEQVEAFNSSIKEDVYKVLSDNFKVYKTKEGETLMWVAFKLYGDYRAWRKLKSWNEEVLDFDLSLAAGTELKYEPMTSKFQWQGKGNPYLILNGDSLSKISKKVYNGEIQHWKSIWLNNQLQVRDPNLIFAGFTLFYLPYEELKRELASDEKI